ncbi:uncharacterized protein LOC114530526 [Dendronephthya gigantea]|uniref:uncharacterized protein LOC114530526 n=1 Tax=Dendronephthya gigantea TaxID=151771 RepID=UPI00106CD9A3|nr:uncharacterized protein LOC114530526 [Dendronephthya gigantea]
MSLIPGLFIVSLAFSTILAQNYILKVVEDVTLERGSTNFNYLPYLIVGTHPGYPLKRSLMRFQNIPAECILPLEATLHIYFVYAHKASSVPSLPDVTRHIVAHTVLKSWSESKATSTERGVGSGLKWERQWLDLGKDAANDAIYSTTVTATPGGKWYTLDVTPQAQKWKSGGSNYGLLLRDTHEVIEGRDFRFASNAYSDQSKHAYITLKCQIQQQSIGGGPKISPIGGGENPV